MDLECQLNLCIGGGNDVRVVYVDEMLFALCLREEQLILCLS